MLTARALQYERAPGGHGSLRPADVAAMLAGLERRRFLAGLLVEAGDWSCLRELERHLFLAAVTLATEQHWSLPRGPGVLRSLGHLALWESTAAGTPCPACGGHGSYQPDPSSPHRVACEDCRGTGRRPLADYRRAELIAVSPSNWTRLWASRYESIYGTFLGWADDARHHLRRQLRRNAAATA
jgi:hypothetical protein